MIPRYYEFLNRVKIMSGNRALDHIPQELKARGADHPILITHRELVEEGTADKLIKAMSESELVFGTIYLCHDPITPEIINSAAEEFKEYRCDSVITLGDASSFQLGRELLDSLNSSVPFVSVPTASAGTEIAGHPDVVVIDPRMTYHLSQRETITTAMDTFCHSIEAYTCLQKNPLSDAYAFSAIKLARENLDSALKNGRDRHARLGLANAAVLSGIAFTNSQTGIAHGLAHGLTESCGIPHAEAVAILLPHCMDYNMIKLDEYYGELLLPLAGPEIYADTLHHERGRKTVQTIRNLLSEYHRKYDLPISLSEIGIKRTDFDGIAAHSLKNVSVLYNPVEVDEADLKNILNLAF